MPIDKTIEKIKEEKGERDLERKAKKFVEIKEKEGKNAALEYFKGLDYESQNYIKNHKIYGAELSNARFRF